MVPWDRERFYVENSIEKIFSSGSYIYVYDVQETVRNARFFLLS
jgi:hypothetical protein